MEIELKFEKVIREAKNYDAIQAWQIFYLYRWSGTHSYHLSGFGKDSGGKSGNLKVMEYVSRKLRDGQLQCGEIHLEPRWACDYPKLIDEYLSRLVPKSS